MTVKPMMDVMTNSLAMSCCDHTRPYRASSSSRLFGSTSILARLFRRFQSVMMSSLFEKRGVKHRSPPVCTFDSLAGDIKEPTARRGCEVRETRFAVLLAYAGIGQHPRHFIIFAIYRATERQDEIGR